MGTEENDLTRAENLWNITFVLKRAKKYCKYEWLRMTFIQ